MFVQEQSMEETIYNGYIDNGKLNTQQERTKATIAQLVFIWFNAHIFIITSLKSAEGSESRALQLLLQSTLFVTLTYSYSDFLAMTTTRAHQTVMSMNYSCGICSITDGTFTHAAHFLINVLLKFAQIR